MLIGILHPDGDSNLARYGLQLLEHGIKGGQIVHLPGVNNVLAGWVNWSAAALPAPPLGAIASSGFHLPQGAFLGAASQGGAT